MTPELSEGVPGLQRTRRASQLTFCGVLAPSDLVFEEQ